MGRKSTFTAGQRRNAVMNVVSRLVDKLHRTEEERDTATLQLKGELII